MEELNRTIGKRLREVREIFNEGGKLSARQFAYLVDETTDKILNYETGRAAISIQLLINLYHRGFNPVYILTGEGSMFAANSEGIKMSNKIENKDISDKTQKKSAVNKEISEINIERLIEKAHAYNVAAGDILKELSKRK